MTYIPFPRLGVAGVASWQLASGHYMPQKLPPELIFPRPDSETPVWAKHRRHYPGIKYEIPIGVAFGSWPFYFELITAPAGATIGAFLQQSGDKLIVTDNYGVVSWSNPTVGTHSFHVRVSFQDGTTPLDVQWTLEVTTTGTIFMDAVNGNDANDGTINSPLQTIDGWYKSSYSDRTYTGYQVCYKNGTYNIQSSDPVNSNIRMEYLNKPLVHYAYTDNNPVWNFDNGTMNFAIISSAETNGFGEYHMSDWYLGGVTCSGGQQAYSSRRWGVFAGVRGPIVYDGTGGGQRCTWYKCPQINWSYTGDSANNGGICFGSNVNNVDRRRNYWFIDRVDVSDVVSVGGYSTTNWNGWYVSNISLALYQNSKTSNTNFGRNVFLSKSSQYKTCYRNIDFSASPTQKFSYEDAGSYAPNIGGWNEVSYCKANYTSLGVGGVVLIINPEAAVYDPVYHYEDFIYRNSWSRYSNTLGDIIWAAANWPVNVQNDVWCSNGDGIYLSYGPVNTQAQGDWRLYSIANNPFDSSLNLVGAARTALLGTHGAEVA